MAINPIIKKVEEREESIDIQEAFNIYSLLRARYISIQTVQLFKNFVHDVDLEVMLDKFQKNFEKQIANLEELGYKFHIIMPNKRPLDVKFAIHVNDTTDNYVYKKIYHDLIEQQISLIHAVRSTSTNDNLRNNIIRDLTSNFNDFDTLYRFGELKGWEEMHPTYKTSVKQEEEQLSVSEAFHIWDHITMRYEQIKLIDILSSFAHDTEFKVILQHSLYIYKNQVNNLEQLALKLNVPLPNRLVIPVTSPIDPETVTDKFMYRIILNLGFIALDTHVTAIIETIKNEALRKLLRELLNSELSYYDKYLKYGKMNGWTRGVPIYGDPVTV